MLASIQKSCVKYPKHRLGEWFYGGTEVQIPSRNIFDLSLLGHLPTLQTSIKRGPDSRFDLKAIFKTLVPKLSPSWIMITINPFHTNHDF